MVAALPYIAIALAGTSAAMGAISSLQQANFQSKMAGQSAMLARRQAVDAEARGGEAAGQSIMEGSKLIGQARAVAGGSGVDVMSENVLDTIGTTRLTSTFDAEMRKSNAIREALGYQMQATNAEAEGSLARMRGAYGAAGSIIGGISQSASIAYSAGLFPKFGRGGNVGTVGGSSAADSKWGGSYDGFDKPDNYG